MRFRATVQLHGKTATGIEIPAEIIEALRAGKKPPVVVRVNGYTYRSTIGTMGGVHLLPISADNRVAAGIRAGDEVDVELHVDDQPRDTAIPDDLTAILHDDAAARQAFDALTPSRRKALILQIEGAKTTDTRHRRLKKAIQDLHQGASGA